MGPYKIAIELLTLGEKISPNNGSTKPYAIYNPVVQDVIGVVGGTEVAFTACPIGILPIEFDYVSSVSVRSAGLIGLWR